MEDQRVCESLHVSVERVSDGPTWLCVRGSFEMDLDHFEVMRHYPAGTETHRVCDEVARLICGWSEFGNLGLSQAMDALRTVDQY